MEEKMEEPVILPSQIPPDEIQEEFLRTSAGPGGQKINKTSSAVRLIFDAANTVLLDEAGRIRLQILAGSSARLADGRIVIQSSESRSLQHNRLLALEKLASLITKASKAPRKRKKTRPAYSSVLKRLSDKKKRSEVKKGRRNTSFE